MFFGKAPRGFPEKIRSRRSSDVRPGDLAALRERLEGDRAPLTRFNMPRRQVDVSVAHKRKGKQSRNFVVYARTGCMTKARIAAVSPEELRALVREFGFSQAWSYLDEPIIVSRAVWERHREWCP